VVCKISGDVVTQIRVAFVQRADNRIFWLMGQLC
jgi:hypothetical protein